MYDEDARFGKRLMDMDRFGKRSMGDLDRFGKRMMDEDRFGKRMMDEDRFGKRMMGDDMRFGKRMMDDMDRFGKRMMDEDRFGKRMMDEDRFVCSITYNLYTMLQKLSKCEVKASICLSLIILLPLRYYVKSNLGEFKRSKNVIFDNFRDSEI